MALQGYTDQPCPLRDLNPQAQYMSWPWITPNSRRLNPLGHHDQDINYIHPNQLNTFLVNRPFPHSLSRYVFRSKWSKIAYNLGINGL